MGVSSSDHRGLISAPVNLPQSVSDRMGLGLNLSADEIEQLTGAIPDISGYSIVGQQLNMNAAM